MTYENLKLVKYIFEQKALLWKTMLYLLLQFQCLQVNDFLSFTYLCLKIEHDLAINGDRF